MQIISFINMKGGVGKTTLAVNVAYGLAFLHPKRVLLVDGDPQFNATQYLLEDDVYLQHTEDSKKGTLADIFVPRQPGAVNTLKGQAKEINRAKMSLSQCTCVIFDGGPGKGKLDLLPSSLKLMYAEDSRRGTETKLLGCCDLGRSHRIIRELCPAAWQITGRRHGQLWRHGTTVHGRTAGASEATHALVADRRPQWFG